MEYSIVGKKITRVDGIEKATGRAIYAGDIKFPNMLYGKVLRSKLPHARILNIDTTRASKLPGVKAVITGKDLPERRYGFVLKDQAVLAKDKVRFIGEPIAAVAAISSDIAEEALELIDVEYEELKAIFDPIEAMNSESPIIHEELNSYMAMWPAIRYGNVCSHTKINRGDVEKGFSESDHIFEDRFLTQMVHQNYIEPHVAIANSDLSGRITIWTSNQSPFGVRSELMEALGIPLNKIRIMMAHVGGGFGGKFGITVEPIALILSQKTDRPVKIAMTREEELTVTHPRHPSIIELKTGVKNDGTIIARDAKIIYDTGAYAGMGPVVNMIGAKYVSGPYKIPNIRANAYSVYTNKSNSGFCRGAGNPQVTFAYESQMDIIAEKLNIDPLELRLKNAVEDGDLSSTGQVLKNVGLKEALKKAAEKINWKSGIKDKNRGKAIASLQYETGGMGSSACVKLNENGSISIMVGAIDIGQGTCTILSQIAAEELGLSIEDVNIAYGDTDTLPYDMGTGADRVTFNTGNAVKKACEDLKNQLFYIAANSLEANIEDLEIREKGIRVKGSPERAIPLMDLAMMTHYFKGGPLIGKCSYLVEEPPFDEKAVEGGMFPSTPAPTFAAQAAEVEVDKTTGRVKVLRFVAAHDVGFAINPMGVEGQIEGGVAMGIGYALSEEILWDKGKVANKFLSDYKVPTALDIPNIDAIIVEDKSELGPYGAKGVGEPGASPTAPAIANAIYNATGIRVKELPITPERLFSYLKNLKKK